MRKFTTIILLFGIFTQVKISAQSVDYKILKDVNSISSTIEASKMISNSTIFMGIASPLTLGTIALLKKDDELLKTSLYLGSALAIDAALTYSLKYAISRNRPLDAYPNQIIAYEESNSKSFPSGHTSFAFASATSLSIAYPKWYVIAPSYFWACSVGYSRMNLGVHYPTDVLAGAVLGAASAWVTWKVNKWFWQKTNNKKLLTLENYSNLNYALLSN